MANIDAWTGCRRALDHDRRQLAKRIEDGIYAFSDLHAMMSFIGAVWREPQIRLLRILEATAASHGTNSMMTHGVGLPAATALVAFGKGDYAEAVNLLLAVHGKSNRFGGSHAQRDIISWTLMEAAIRSGIARAPRR